MKVWLCYMNAGGGHKAPAQALARAMRALDSSVEPELINLADKASFFLRFLMEDGYVWLIDRAPLLYMLVYELSLLKPFIALEHTLSLFFLKRKFKHKIASEKPDLIVSTFFLVEAVYQALQELGSTTPFYVVVTEPYSTPPVWFYNKNIPYIVFSEQAKKIGERERVRVIQQFAPIINNPLKQPLSTEQRKIWRAKLQLDLEKKIVLLIGGGAGLPKGEKMVREFVCSSLDAQYVVVCGNNVNYKNKVTKISANSSKNIRIFGFVDFVPELIALADVVVTKAGGGVIAEVMAQAKPLLITHYIYGQEKGTMEHVVDEGVGWFEPDPARATQKIMQFFGNQQEQYKIQERYHAISFRAGNEPIAQFLLGQVRHRT